MLTIILNNLFSFSHIRALFLISVEVSQCLYIGTVLSQITLSRINELCGANRVTITVTHHAQLNY